MSTIEIEKKLVQILKELLGEDYREVLDLKSDLDDHVLHVVLSESSQALSFVMYIEEEFDLEFDDDEVDLNFFLSIETIVSLIQKHKELENVEA
ncbi:MAG: hypothetical protein R8G66_05815 [Cytophagales bacterium]|nr:hypothetical protein [Cytophagales bacterium]